MTLSPRSSAKTAYECLISYAYGDTNWKDKLTAYNGKSITYDAIGNPLNDGTWAYEWQTGRQLKRMSAEGKAVSFKYDHNGLRTQKVVEQSWYPETTNYYLHGKLLTHMTVDYRDTSETAHQDNLHFFYDAQSRPAKVSYNGVIYTYIHNLQGDIVGPLDNSGTLVVEYKYDAWGKPIAATGSLAATLDKRNPFRYRGYVYDEETGLYYLRSRFYNVAVGRFLNADSCVGKISVLEQHNQFSYCANVPVGLRDESGQSFLSELKRFGKQLAYNYLYSSQIKFGNKVCLDIKANVSMNATVSLEKLVSIGWNYSKLPDEFESERLLEKGDQFDREILSCNEKFDCLWIYIDEYLAFYGEKAQYGSFASCVYGSPNYVIGLYEPKSGQLFFKESDS